MGGGRTQENVKMRVEVAAGSRGGGGRGRGGRTSKDSREYCGCPKRRLGEIAGREDGIVRKVGEGWGKAG